MLPKSTQSLSRRPSTASTGRCFPRAWTRSAAARRTTSAGWARSRRRATGSRWNSSRRFSPLATAARRWAPTACSPKASRCSMPPSWSRASEARLIPDASLKLPNPSFEEVSKNRFPGYKFHDQPGEISFADTAVKHSGTTSLRMENFTANPHGHGRVMQEIRVQSAALLPGQRLGEDGRPSAGRRLSDDGAGQGPRLGPADVRHARHARLAEADHAGQQPGLRRVQPLRRRVGREEGPVLAR